MLAIELSGPLGVSSSDDINNMDKRALCSYLGHELKDPLVSAVLEKQYSEMQKMCSTLTKNSVRDLRNMLRDLMKATVPPEGHEYMYMLPWYEEVDNMKKADLYRHTVTGHFMAIKKILKSQPRWGSDLQVRQLVELEVQHLSTLKPICKQHILCFDKAFLEEPGDYLRNILMVMKHSVVLLTTRHSRIFHEIS